MDGGSSSRLRGGTYRKVIMNTMLVVILVVMVIWMVILMLMVMGMGMLVVMMMVVVVVVTLKDARLQQCVVRGQRLLELPLVLERRDP